jgi:cysteine desulfurase
MTVYLDHAATTPLRPEALEAMLPYLTEHWGNPSSPHALGRRARAGLDEARETIAARLGARPREVVLTAGGTEAINLGIKGAAWAGKARGHRIVTTGVEHHAVSGALTHLEKFGFEVVTVPVDRYGRVDPDEVDAAIGERTILVALGLANNEVGTVQPVAAVAERAHARPGVLVFVDAVQAAAWLDIDVDALGADLLAIGAHKFEGPKGAGALYLRQGTHILAQTHGGTQERYRRAGTENVAGAVGMAVAFDLAARERPTVVPAVRARRDRLREAVLGIDGVEPTGHPVDRLPNHCSVVAPGADGATVVHALDLAGIAISTGSACTSGSTEPSHVLAAIGYPADEARGALRLSLGRTTSEADVEAAAAAVPRAVAEIRAAAIAPGPGPDGAEPGRADPEQADQDLPGVTR